MLDASLTQGLDYHALNAMLNLYDEDGNIQFEADRMAARQYFLQHVNQNTVFFHSLEEKLGFLVDGHVPEEVVATSEFVWSGTRPPDAGAHTSANMPPGAGEHDY